ncbi:MAG: hypothetical protein J6W76_03875, partial [Spirochaetales bacterium]|nr:hypothetical protein [Spirochaetales bacterium]
KERIELLSDAPDIVEWAFGDLPPYKAWEAIYPKKVEPATVLKVLNDEIDILTKLNEESDDDLQHKIYELAAKYEVKAGAVFMPLRIALTGTNKSPELFPVMHVLGKDKVLARIRAAIDKIQSEQS